MHPGHYKENASVFGTKKEPWEAPAKDPSSAETWSSERAHVKSETVWKGAGGKEPEKSQLLKQHSDLSEPASTVSF
ncbi:hypothetical protein RB195_024840 [Necator americanus]|uniref:Uncharacterized protein n=1 Tax=Necator americanus TaxID=51031 RepID=A0ABR1ERZ1_NECAM